MSGKSECLKKKEQLERDINSYTLAIDAQRQFTEDELEYFDELEFPDDQDEEIMWDQIEENDKRIKEYEQKVAHLKEELDILGEYCPEEEEVETDTETTSGSPEDGKNVDNAGTEKEPPPPLLEFDEGDKNDRLWSGHLATNADAAKKLDSLRKSYAKNGGIKGFEVPWDWRLGNAYTYSESIGNHMPKGAEWVGSPSIMNVNTLIRFGHVASKHHHSLLLDNEGNHSFKTGGLSRAVVRWDSIDNKDYGKGEDGGGRNVVYLSQGDKEKYGVGGNQDVFEDSSSALYVESEDENQEIWEATKKDVQFDGKPLLDPAEVTVDKIEDSPKQNDPNNKDFWYNYFGWVECADAPGSKNKLWVLQVHCQKNKDGTGSSIGGDMAAEDKASLKKRMATDNAKIDAQVKRVWKSKGFVIVKRFLIEDTLEAVNTEPLEPTFENLTNIENFSGKEQFIYKWTDFLYSKNFGIVPNNYLITLRRYPMPALDNGAIFGQETSLKTVLPISTMVCWAGEVEGNPLADILGVSWKLNWKDISSETTPVQGQEQGADSGPFKGVSKWLGVASAASGGGNFGAISGWDDQRAKFDPYEGGQYANRVYGPVNSIIKTKAREQGIESAHPITLKFNYSLKSIGGVNPKAAMLDIFANSLAMTYNNADFWGGANRYFPNKPQYPFPGKKKGQEAWYSGDVTGFIDSIGQQLTETVTGLAGTLKDLMNNPKAALKKLAEGASSVFMASKSKENRPEILKFKALLTGDPIGEWHLTVGNPFNPIVMIGNLVVMDTKVLFSNQLGNDDFPEDMTIEIQLDHARPRDKGDLESMFNRGEGRLHYAPFGQANDLWNTASSTSNSKIDSSWNRDGSDAGDGIGKTPPTNANGSVDSAVSNTGKLYGESSKQAFALSSKMGFKSAE